MKNRQFRDHLLGTLAVSALLLGLSPAALGQEAPIVQPGAPGQASRDLSADEAVKIADTSYSPDDVKFMQDMIPHHYQATRMAVLVPERTNNPEIRELAGRINASQDDEIAFMTQWLEERGEEAPDPADAMGMHMQHKMAGMASKEDMARLATLKGTEFDELFLQLMIPHHEGAITMADRLLDQPGSAYDPVLLDFVNGVVADQKSEIKRMNVLLSALSVDPRVGLTAGFRDAGEAISNMTLVAALPKPSGFFDPENPSDLPPKKPAKTDEGDEAEGADAADREQGDDANEGTQWGERSPLLSFSNTDMAFSGDVLVAGNYHGFNIYKLQDTGVPKLYSSVVCPGGQGDVSIVGDLLIMSVEQTRGRVDCGLQGISEEVSEERFRGLRIFDISNLARPVQVGQVQTCRGSHTHSVVVENDGGNIIVYNSGTGRVRDEEELAGCVDGLPGDDATALFSIDVIEIPIDNPGAARIIDSPRVFADDETGRIAGLWQGGDHGDETQRTRRTDQCHDITVFPSLKLAAGACSGNGIILDIADPRAPKRIDDVTDKGFAYWHSATFNNDGTKVLFTDEWGGGGRPRCRAQDPMDWGADAIYDIEDGKLVYRSHYKIGAPQSEEENCVAHNGSVVPVPGRDIFVQAWYQGGISVIDFTDSSNPVEIAYFDRGPIHPERMVLGGYWSTYFYGGKIYGTEIVRGLDVLTLEPSEFLTENEIAAAALADQGRTFNPQQQYPVAWPAHPTVAMAYMDQLKREAALSDADEAALTTALTSARSLIESDGRDKGLARDLERLAKSFKGKKTAAKRNSALADTLDRIAARLR